MEVTDYLDPIDVLACTSEEVLSEYRRREGIENKLAVIDNFLIRWETDPALCALRKLQIEFPNDLDWFNVSTPLSLDALRGKFIILDFFTYCCINCMHVLPELHALEQLFSIERGLVVIGVHSPKFENEKDAANILAAAQRYGITHPIVNDPRSQLWRAIGIRCWPSLLILSPRGVPLLLLMGEGHAIFLKHLIERALQYFTHTKEIKYFGIPLRPSTDLLPASNLRFPAKITRSDEGKFAIADAGNNRILIVGLDGVVQYKIGGINTGFVDGDFAKARFHSPQGVTFLDSNTLFVADTQNHALRKITLSECKVETLVGTGQQSNDRTGGREGPLQPISSPWDVAIYKTRDMDMSFHADEQNIPEKAIVLVSMAGTHQIWGYFPEGIIWWRFRKFEPRTCVSIIGNGLEENRNNSYPQNAAFAQPSGLAMAKNYLFIADSESSSIRKAHMIDGKVTGVVGGDRNPLNLFAFGDVDGKQYSAKLQHPLSLAYNHRNDKVYVADTYNHKIKVIDPATSTIETVPIKSETGDIFLFSEPAGLCFDATGDYLLVSNTNNHNIQIVDMDTLITKNFNLNFCHSLSSEIDAPLPMRRELNLFKQLPLHNYKSLNLIVNIKLQDGLYFTPDAKQRWSISASNSNLQTSSNIGQIENGTFNLNLSRLDTQEPIKQENIKLDIVLCLCDSKSCLMKRFSLVLCDDNNANVESMDDDNNDVNIDINVNFSEIQIL